MAVKSNLNVEVTGETGEDTEIIEPTLTDKNFERIFSVGNGEKEIIATVWGSDDGQNWVEETSKEIGPHIYDILITGVSHYPWVKLVARTKNPMDTSIVDGFLNYNELT